MKLCLVILLSFALGTPLFEAKSAEVNLPGYAWRVLGGPERENGNPVEIIENTGGDVTVSVEHRRGTVMRSIPSTALPATVTFRFQSSYDPTARELPTELFGTGDFRIFLGCRAGRSKKSPESQSGNNDSFGDYEGVQFRVFPHLGRSPQRIKTGEESHTATSLWIRYVDPGRRHDGMGLPHTGLLSDSSQNRNKQQGIHNSGWSRVALWEGGLGLRNGEAALITIHLTRDTVRIKAGGREFTHQLQPDERRNSRVDTIAIGHTNISRGYVQFRVSGLHVTPDSQ